MDLSRTSFTFNPIGMQRSWNQRGKLIPNRICPVRIGNKSQLECTAGHVQLSDSSDKITGKDTLDSDWTQDELDAISSLFERPLPPQIYRKKRRERPMPLPLPHKIMSTDGTPTPKHHIRCVSKTILSSRNLFTNQVRKNPDVLITIAREIAALPSQSDVSEVLDRWAPFLRKGSLSMTIRELGHMGLPDRVLQTIFWAQKRAGSSKPGPKLFPDDRTLASAVEVLAQFDELKITPELDKWILTATRPVLESMAKGFIKAEKLHLARKILLLVKDKNRRLDPSVHAKLILAAGRTPDRYKLAATLIQELGERDDFDLRSEDCTSVMKVCIKLGMFETVERLFCWYRERNKEGPSIVMYTTVIHSRYCNQRYRDGMALVWEIEEQNYLLDLPAYRVVIRLCVALNDLERAIRYFMRLKEAGFNPTYDIYRDLIKGYAFAGRYWKCQQLRKELELGGMRLDNELEAFFMQMNGK
jgi:pentatricopeptide repeat protein